ncbi:MAG: universal stress protein [Cyclobacteriaceae bacterium]|jgi:nucleotide-binding universal stress UspA family protein|nr:universal stress protein [Cytophagales bacterium]HNP75836.1 universal stress protein [Cyclobacteriaceae bacterium]
MIRTLGLAIAFSPTADRMLKAASVLLRIFNARLVLIHVGDHGAKEEALMQSMLSAHQLNPEIVSVCWEKGNTVRAILRACETQKVDLLLAGALTKENLIQYYIGTVARQIMRKANCSVMLLTQPVDEARGFKNIVVDAEESPHVMDSLQMAIKLSGSGRDSWMHVVRELNLYGLAMSASDQCSEDEYKAIRQGLVREEIEKVEKLLQDIPHEGVTTNIKVVAGKSGYELAQFARRKKADLLVVGAPPRRFQLLDRVFTHDLEYVFADLPCNLLIVQRRKASHG